MRFPLALPLVACSAVFLPLLALAEEVEDLVGAARAILDPYHAGSEGTGDARKLRPVYWTPADREPAQQYRERLTRILVHIQKFYADENQRLGFGPRSFNLPIEADGLLEIPLVTGEQNFSEYARDSGSKIRKECLPALRDAGLEPDRETLVIFCNMGEWDEQKLRWEHRSPYYAGGSHRAGNAWQVDSPILDTLALAQKEPVIWDGEYGKISMGKHNSIFIGGVAHELGHALALPHCRGATAEQNLGTALMGSGNRTYADELREEGKGSYLSLTSALRLASHPQFSGSTKGMNQPAKGSFSELDVQATDTGLTVSGGVSGQPPVYGVVAYLDPEGSGDYDSITAVAVPDAEGRFQLAYESLPQGKSCRLRLFGLHANGAYFRQELALQTDAEGRADLQWIRAKRALADPLAEFAKGNPEGLRQLAGQGDLLEQRVAARLLQAQARDDSQLPTPSEVEDSVLVLPLSDARAGQAEVGWGEVSYDRLPGPSPLLESRGELFAHGIYAHAPASHGFLLGGKWNRLAGACGMAAGKNGAVSFEVRGDGKVLWKSRQGRRERNPEHFEIDVQGVETLELLVDALGDPSADWGAWFEPQLERGF